MFLVCSVAGLDHLSVTIGMSHRSPFIMPVADVAVACWGSWAELCH